MKGSDLGIVNSLINKKVKDTDVGNLANEIKDVQSQLDDIVQDTTNKFSSVEAKKADKTEVRLKSVANTLNDCDTEMLTAIRGGQGANFNLLSIPRDLSVTFGKLENKLQQMINPLFDGVALTWHNGSYYNYIDGVITSGDNNYNYADVVNVVAGEMYKISGQCKWGANLYVITDSTGKVLSAFPNANIKQTYTDVLFEIPSNGAKLLLNKTDGINTVLSKLNYYTFNGLKITENTVETKAIKNNAINYDKLDTKIQNVFSETYEPLPLVWHSGGYYDYRTGIVSVDSDITYCYADIVNVNAGDKFILNGRSRWYAGLYTVLDSARNVISTFPNKYETGTTYSNVRLTIPTNGVKLLINKTQGVETVLKKLSGYKIDKTILKKWVAFGDSLTDSVTLSGGKNYVDLISDNLGLATLNFGKGGTGYINGNGGTQQFYNRTSSIPSDTDILTVFGSFNDLYIENIPIGVITDTEPTTLYGAINKFLNNCWAINPSMVIAIISPTPWWNWWKGHSDSARVKKCVDYVQVLKTVAEYYSLPFLDLFSGSNLRPWDSGFKTTYYLNGDGVHPNSVGHEKHIYPKIESFIKTLIR